MTFQNIYILSATPAFDLSEYKNWHKFSDLYIYKIYINSQISIYFCIVKIFN